MKTSRQGVCDESWALRDMRELQDAIRAECYLVNSSTLLEIERNTYLRMVEYQITQDQNIIPLPTRFFQQRIHLSSPNEPLDIYIRPQFLVEIDIRIPNHVIHQALVGIIGNDHFFGAAHGSSEGW